MKSRLGSFHRFFFFVYMFIVVAMHILLEAGKTSLSFVFPNLHGA